MEATISALERWLGLIGLAAALVTLGILVTGLWRGLGQPAGRTTGRPPRLLQKSLYYFIVVAGFVGLSILLWRTLPVTLSTGVRIAILVCGSLLFFPGLVLVVWGRLTLGKLYDVSSSFGARLHVDHQLVTHGPYALVRHPVYLGVLLAGLGGLLIYRTWTFVMLVFIFPSLLMRARREEALLAAEFGRQWLAYKQKVPGWIPRLYR